MISEEGNVVSLEMKTRKIDPEVKDQLSKIAIRFYRNVKLGEKGIMDNADRVVDFIVMYDDLKEIVEKNNLCPHLQ